MRSRTKKEKKKSVSKRTKRKSSQSVSNSARPRRSCNKRQLTPFAKKLTVSSKSRQKEVQMNLTKSNKKT